MARALSNLGLLISFALTGLALAASPAGAADRYGPGDPGGYAGPDNGYAPDRYQPRDEREAVDPYAMHDRVLGRDGRTDQRGFDRSDRAYGDARGYQRSDETRVVRRFSDGDEREAVDPYARQDRVIRQQRWSDGGGYDRSGRPYDEDRDYARSRIMHDGGGAWGYADQGYAGRGYADQDYSGQGYVDQGYADQRAGGFEDEQYGRVDRVYADGDVWRTREAYVSEPVYDARGEGYVDACAIAHARVGERCPFAEEGRRVFREDRAFIENEQLPEDFFVSEGGVGPGIVDFGGGGGGGGFAFADSASNANASASAMASASAKVSVRLAVMAHNHQMMMHHYPSHPMGHGCGCKK